MEDHKGLAPPPYSPIYPSESAGIPLEAGLSLPYLPTAPPVQAPPVIQAAPAPTVHNISVVTNTNPKWTGSCPVCHSGNFRTSFTCCGWLCCIFLFPVGILCCLCWSRKKCNNCGFSPA